VTLSAYNRGIRANSQGCQSCDGRAARAASKYFSALLDGAQFRTHGSPILWEDAADAKIGLTIDYLRPNDELWLRIWSLYCLQGLAVGDTQKLFESDIASLCVKSRALQAS
jgi:hypothetical protein